MKHYIDAIAADTPDDSYHLVILASRIDNFYPLVEFKLWAAHPKFFRLSVHCGFLQKKRHPVWIPRMFNSGQWFTVMRILVPRSPN